MWFQQWVQHTGMDASVRFVDVGSFEMMLVLLLQFEMVEHYLPPMELSDFQMR